VVVLNDGQSVPAFGTAVFKNLAPIGGRHAGTETMHAQTASDFWLVSTLRHKTRFLSNNFKDISVLGPLYLNISSVNNHAPVTDETRLYPKLWILESNRMEKWLRFSQNK
jgi:hypothetical protein